MADGAFERLKRDARRDDYRSMAALARALLAAGTSPEEVLHTCYGVWFPEETFGGVLLCHDLDELEAGRSTVVGFQANLEPDAEPTRYGDSLAELHASYADAARRLERAIRP